MIINKPDHASGVVYLQDVGEDLEDRFDDEPPTGVKWGDAYKVTVAVEKL